MKQILKKLEASKDFNTSPKFLKEVDDIVSDKPKSIVALEELIETASKSEKADNPEPKNEQINNDLNIPKMNPLMGMINIPAMPKTFNKFDMIPGNSPQAITNTVNQPLPGMKTPLKL